MTKKELSQLYYLNREIEELQKRIMELEALAFSCTVQVTGMPSNNGFTDRLGQYVAEIVDLKTLLNINLKKCIHELNRLNHYIQSIDDSEMRLILSLRYVKGLSWQQIAFNIGETDEQYPRKKHNRFLKNNKVDEKDEFKVI
jgi:hypothetical protein